MPFMAAILVKRNRGATEEENSSQKSKLKLTIDLRKVGLLTHVASNGKGPRRRGTSYFSIIESSREGTV